MESVVLITGVAGFLGSHLADLLVSNGNKVIGVDNLFRGKIENISHLLEVDNFVYFKKDLTDEVDVSYIFSVLNKYKLDYIFHYAAINGTEHFYDKSYYTFSVNCTATDNILKLATEHKKSLKKLIYASSSEVYGEPSILPTPESEMISLNIYADRDSYAGSKVYGEFVIRLYCQSEGVPYTILRPFNTYGTRMDNTKYGQVIPEFIRKLKDDVFTIIGNGKQTRSFCHVRDHVLLAEKIMYSEKAENRVINIGNDNEVTIVELAELLHKIVGKEFIPKYIEERKFDIQRRCPDISVLKEVTGIKPSIELYDGLLEMV